MKTYPYLCNVIKKTYTMRNEGKSPFENYPTFVLHAPSREDNLEVPKSGKELRRERRKLERKKR